MHLAKRPHVAIKNITFLSGKEFELHPNDKVLIVGPNNSGKSQALREIFANASDEPSSSNKVISNLTLNKDKNTAELHEFLQEQAFFDTTKQHFLYEDWFLPTNLLPKWNSPRIPRSMVAGFLKLITSEDRLQICTQQNSIGP